MEFMISIGFKILEGRLLKIFIPAYNTSLQKHTRLVTDLDNRALFLVPTTFIDNVFLTVHHSIELFH